MKKDEFIPYGEEWTAMLMKYTKKELIGLLKTSYQKNKELIKENKVLKKGSYFSLEQY